MSDRPNIIWSNENLDYEDWRDSLAEDYPDLTEAQREALMYELNADYLDDERTNLNIQLSQPILVIADLGRWNGRVMDYKEIPSDGTNHYLYRTYKDGVTEEQIDRLKGKIYNGTATRADITRLTSRLGDEIARVYGWEIPKPKLKQQEAR